MLKDFRFSHVKMGELGQFCRPCRMDLIVTSLKFLRHRGSKSSPKAKIQLGHVSRHPQVSPPCKEIQIMLTFECETWCPKTTRNYL